MGDFLIVSKIEQIQEYKQIVDEYHLGFELNDFYDPSVLDDPCRQQELIEQYHRFGLPENSTMHGAFLDVVLFSEDPQIRRISQLRMSQSMDIAQRAGVKGVVFHTNSNPVLSGDYYDSRVVNMVSEYVAKLLETYPDIEIYLENMFDANPNLLARIAQNLESYPGFGICLDYAHAVISGTEVEVWVDSLAQYVRHLHINDNDLRRDLQLAVGDGDIDWKQFASYYRQYFSSCSTLIETEQPEQQIRSLQYLKQLL